MSATCGSCQQVMSPGTACTLKTYDDFPDGLPWDRIPYDHGEPGNCPDCGTPDGGLHHPGCDKERCPSCRGQAISCDCTDPEDEG